MHKWPLILIVGGALWFLADLACALQPHRIVEVWTVTFSIALVAGAIAGLRRKPLRPALAWLLRYLATFAICAALGASLGQLGGLRSAIAIDVASAVTLASLYLASALWSSLLRVAFIVSGTVAWAAAMAAYLWLPNQAHFVMAAAGGLLLVLPGAALHRLLPPPRAR